MKFELDSEKGTCRIAVDGTTVEFPTGEIYTIAKAADTIYYRDTVAEAIRSYVEQHGNLPEETLNNQEAAEAILDEFVRLLYEEDPLREEDLMWEAISAYIQHKHLKDHYRGISTRAQRPSA